VSLERVREWRQRGADDARVVSVGACPRLIPGITLNTSPTDYRPIKKMRETGLSGKTWELLDEGN